MKKQVLTDNLWNPGKENDKRGGYGGIGGIGGGGGGGASRRIYKEIEIKKGWFVTAHQDEDNLVIRF